MAGDAEQTDSSGKYTFGGGAAAAKKYWPTIFKAVELVCRINILFKLRTARYIFHFGSWHYHQFYSLHTDFVHTLYWLNWRPRSEFPNPSIRIATNRCTLLRNFWIVSDIFHRVFDRKTHPRWVREFIGIIKTFQFIETVSFCQQIDGHGRRLPFWHALQPSCSCFVDSFCWKIIQIPRSATFGHQIRPGSFSKCFIRMLFHHKLIMTNSTLDKYSLITF